MFVDIDYAPNFRRSDNELEAFVVFSICVAGKNADTTKKSLLSFFDKWHAISAKTTPFEIIRSFSNQKELAQALKDEGIGCQTRRAEYLCDLVNSDIDLQRCSVEELEGIKGIGPKTARFFILFSRENENHAVLDVHILRWLQQSGFDVPDITPSASKKYREIEQLFIEQFKKSIEVDSMSLADFDYMIWEKMSGRDDHE